MPNLPIPPEWQPLVAALIVPLALVGWIVTYIRALRKPPPAAMADATLRAFGIALNDSLALERVSRDIVSAIDRLTKAVEVFSLDLRTHRSTRSEGPTTRRR